MLGLSLLKQGRERRREREGEREVVSSGREEAAAQTVETVALAHRGGLKQINKQNCTHSS